MIKLGAGALSFTVEDDGCGLRAEDLDVLGTVRYATSKMRSMADLDSGIQTLGFRGEAVASLFTVAAEVCITTRARGSFETLIKTARGGGTEICSGPSALQLTHSGTIISVKRFLFNQPVRQRQLSAQAGDIEANTIQAVLRMALPFVDVGVTLLRAPAGQALLHLPRGRDVRSMFLRLAPDQPPSLPLLQLAGQRGYGMSALLGGLPAAYPHTQHQYLYVNRRHVVSTPISALLNAHFLRAYLRAGYHLQQQQQQQQQQQPGGCDAGVSGGAGGRASRNNSSGVKAFPAFMLMIQCPYGEYNVTAEPDKSDVVFRDLPLLQSLLKGLAAQAWGGDGDPGGAAAEGGGRGTAAAAGAPPGRDAHEPPQGQGRGTGADAGRGSLFDDLEQDASPTLSRALAQYSAQRQASAAAAAALRPAAAACARGPLQELLRLQATSTGRQLDESKTMSLAAVAAASPVDAPATARGARTGAAEETQTCGEDANRPGAVSTACDRFGVPPNLAGRCIDGTVAQGSEGPASLAAPCVDRTQRRLSQPMVDGQQEAYESQEALQPRTGSRSGAAKSDNNLMRPCGLGVDVGEHDGASGFDTGLMGTWTSAPVVGSDSPSQVAPCGSLSALVSRQQTAGRSESTPDCGTSEAAAVDTRGMDAAAGHADTPVVQRLRTIPSGSPLPEISPGLGSAEAPAGFTSFPWRGKDGSNRVCDGSPGAMDTDDVRVLSFDAPAAAQGCRTPAAGTPSWDNDSTDLELAVSPTWPCGAGGWDAPAPPIDCRLLSDRPRLHARIPPNVAGSPDAFDDWPVPHGVAGAGRSGSAVSRAGSHDDLDVSLWDVGTPGITPPGGTAGGERWLDDGDTTLSLAALSAPGLGVTHASSPLGARNGTPGTHDAEGDVTLDFDWDTPTGGDTPPLFKRPKVAATEGNVAGAARAVGTAKPAATLQESDPASRNPVVGFDGFLRDLRDTPDAGGVPVRPLPPRRTAHPHARNAGSSAAPQGGQRPPNAAPGPRDAPPSSTSPTETTAQDAAPAAALPPAPRSGQAAPGGPESSPAKPDLPHREHILVGVGLPAAARPAGSAASADEADDPAESSSLSPLARFLSFAHVGSDPGKYGPAGGAAGSAIGSDGGTPESAASASAPAQPPPGSAVCASPDGAPGSASGSTRAHPQARLLAVAEAEPPKLTPSSCGARAAVQPSLHCSASAVPRGEETVKPSGHGAPNATAAGAAARTAACATPACSALSAGNSLTTPGRAVRSVSCRHLRTSPTRLVQSAPPHAKKRARTVHGNPACSLASRSQAAPATAAASNAAPVLRAQGTAGAQLLSTAAAEPAVAHDAGKLREHVNDRGGGAPMALRPGASAAMPQPGEAAPLSGPTAPGCTTRPAADVPPQPRHQAAEGAAAPLPEHIAQGQRLPKPVCSFLWPPRAGAGAARGAERRPAGPAEPCPGGLTATTAAAVDKSAAVETSPQPEHTPISKGLLARDHGPRSAGQPSTGSASVAAGGSVTGILKRRSSLGSAASKAKRVRFASPVEGGDTGPAPAAAAGLGHGCRELPGRPRNKICPDPKAESSIGLFGSARSGDDATARPAAAQTAPAAASQLASLRGELPTQGAQGGDRPPAGASCPMAAAISTASPRLLPSASASGTQTCTSTPAASVCFPMISPTVASTGSQPPPPLQPQPQLLRQQQLLQREQQAHRQSVLPEMLLPNLSEGDRHVLCLERDLMRLAAPGERLVPAEVSRDALAQAASVMGQVARKFIPAMTSGGTLLVVDQHAAHERVRLEALTDQLRRAVRATAPPGDTHGNGHTASGRVRAEAAGGSSASTSSTSSGTHGGDGVAGEMAGNPSSRGGGAGGDDADGSLLCSQTLPAPRQLQLATHEAATLARHAGAVEAWGWRLRPVSAAGCGGDGSSAAAAALSKSAPASRAVDTGGELAAPHVAGVGGSGWLLAAVPFVCGAALTNPVDLQAYLQQLHETGSAALLPPAVLRVLRSKACRSAIMFGDPLTQGQAGALLAALRTTALWAQCAHGRPTVAPLVHLPTLRALLDRRRAALGNSGRSHGEGGGGGGNVGVSSGSGDHDGRGGARGRLCAGAVRARLARLRGADTRDGTPAPIGAVSTLAGDIGTRVT